MKFKQALGLVIGLVVGVVGGVLFSKSLRPEPGSLQDRLEIAEEKLGRSDRDVRSMQKHINRQEGMREGAFGDLAFAEATGFAKADL